MTYLVDTGPLVSAFARKEDAFKDWAENLLATLVTCEAVIVEAAHLLRSPVRLLEAVERKLIVCRFDLQRDAGPLRELCGKHADHPMNLADACLVRLFESFREGTATIVTVDRRDFSTYRTRKGRPLQCAFLPDA